MHPEASDASADGARDRCRRRGRAARVDDEERWIPCPSLSTGRLVRSFVRACVDVVRDDGFEKRRPFVRWLVGSNERLPFFVCRVNPNVQTRVTRRPVVVNLIISHTL